MIDIDSLTVKELREIAALAGCAGKAKRKTSPLPFKVGDALLIRTVTMIQLGRVTAIGSDFFTMEDGGWVADTARFGECLATGKINEFERAPSWFMVGRGAVVDVYPWPHAIPKESK